MAHATVDRRPPQRPPEPTVTAVAPGTLVKTLYGRARRDHRDQSVLLRWGPAKTANSEVTGQAGGYTVPPGYSATLLRSYAEHGILYRLGYRVDLETYTGTLPTVDTTSATAGTSPFFGGTVFQWRPQGQALPETDPAFAAVTLTSWDLVGYSVISNQLLADMQPDGEDRLMKLLGRAAAWGADWAFFNGQGSNSKQPLGLLNSPGAKSVTRAVAASVGPTDVDAMTRAFLPGSYGAGIWCCSPTALGKVTVLPGYQSNQPVRRRKAGQCGWLNALPVYVTEKLPTLGTTGDLVLVDPSMYVVGMRQEALVELSTQEPTQYLKNRSVIRTWLRADGKYLLPTTVTLANADVCSGVVVLN